MSVGKEQAGRRRLDPADRKLEIVRTTYEMIARDGPAGLSMRAIARQCGMSAPGLMHHFPTLSDLLRAVLEERARIGQDAIRTIVVDAGDALTLKMLADGLVRYYYSVRAEETRNFDVLEAESFTRGHPAHGAYSRTVVQPLPLTRRLAASEYEDPEAVLSMLSLLADGLRARWLRDLQAVDRWDEWVQVRDRVFRTFQPRRPTIR